MNPVRFSRWLFVALVTIVLPRCGLADPRFDYFLHCAGCHLENGAGAPPEVPDLRSNLDLFLASESGRAYLSRVPGAAQAPIDDAAMAALLNWMIGNFRPDLSASAPFDEAFVATMRANPLKDPLRYRALLLSGDAPTPDADL